MSARTVIVSCTAGLLLVAGCGHPVSIVTSGVQGRVLMSGGPASMVASPSPRPYPNTEIAIWDASGSLVVKVDTGQDGRFKIALEPGSYRLVPRPTVGNPGMRPMKLTVTPGHYTFVTVWAQVR